VKRELLLGAKLDIMGDGGGREGGGCHFEVVERKVKATRK
jgi:hypothetical protein